MNFKNNGNMKPTEADLNIIQMYLDYYGLTASAVYKDKQYNNRYPNGRYGYIVVTTINNIEVPAVMYSDEDKITPDMMSGLMEYFIRKSRSDALVLKSWLIKGQTNDRPLQDTDPQSGLEGTIS